MASNTSLSTANQANGVTLAIVTVVIYLLSLKNVNIPDNVSDALMVIIAGLTHYLTSRLTKSATGENAAPGPESAQQ